MRSNDSALRYSGQIRTTSRPDATALSAEAKNSERQRKRKRMGAQCGDGRGEHKTAHAPKETAAGKSYRRRPLIYCYLLAGV